MSKTDTIRLNMLGLPVIQSIDDFSNQTHISKFTIYQLSQNSDKYYKTYTIPKKSGKLRDISQPSKKLKGLQSWVLVNILNKLKVSNSCKGFEKGSSTYDNAKPHIGANSVLTIDLKDFFPTITQKQIFNIFRAIGYNNLIAIILSKICTYKETLPQGSPCSPKLANLTAWRLDVRLQGYVGKRGINYTRYADDLSFSGLTPSKVIQIIPKVKEIIQDEGYIINTSKTRIAGLSRAKIVTGLTISNNSIGIGKNKYKTLRAKIFHLTKDSEQKNKKLLYEVNGWLAYLKSVDVRRLNKARKFIHDLKVKYPTTLIMELKWDKK
ncbi:retron St85 family RNA-directed DNA polymerase [Pedobacter sp. UC225_61]|uniref:retron St85 family RNA-directed DNA polymerase n=1 Tax=Pedobacter sp. UC225_61 TaxID=3374623 RepID=UPI00379D65D0